MMPITSLMAQLHPLGQDQIRYNMTFSHVMPLQSASPATNAAANGL